MPVTRSPPPPSTAARQKASRPAQPTQPIAHDPDATIIDDINQSCADLPTEAVLPAPMISAGPATSATLELNLTKARKEATKADFEKFNKELKQIKPCSETSKELFETYADMTQQVIDILNFPIKTVTKELRQSAMERLISIKEHLIEQSTKPLMQPTPVMLPCECATKTSDNSEFNKTILEELKEINKRLDVKVRESNTYASALSKPLSNLTSVNLSKPVVPKQIGKTPVSFAMIVKSDKLKTAKDIKQKITQSKICPKAKASPKGMYNLGEDKVKLSFASPEEREKVMNQMKDLPDLKVEAVRKRNPLIQLRWIPAWVKSEDIVKDYLLPQNDKLKQLIPEMQESDFKIRFKIRPRKFRPREPKSLDQEPYHLVIETESKIYRALMKVKDLCIDTRMCQILPFIPFRQCFKCCGFGHIAKNCGSQDNPPKAICAYCAGEHAYQDCPNRPKDPKQKQNPCCFNCKAAKLKHGHMATSPDCPFVQKARIKAGSNVDW